MKTNICMLRIFIAALAVFTLSCTQEEGLYKDKEKEKPEINPSGRYSFIISGGRNQTKGETPDTRAFLDLDTYDYWWDPGDKVVMAISAVDNPTAIVSGFEKMELSAMNLQERVLRTTFLADLVQQEYQNLMTAGTHFDFYSFFPHNVNGWVSTSTSFPAYLEFTMPNSYTIAPNTFVDAIYAPMVGVVKNKEPEIFFPEEEVDPVYQLGGLHFDYEHILSYAAIEMDVRLLPEDVTSLTMTVGDALNNTTRINGRMEYDPSSGYYTLTGGSNSVTVNITGGLTVGSGQTLYIPMPVKDLSGQKLTFTFTTANSGSYAYRPLATSSGVNFERGKIHRIRVAPAAQYAAGTSFTVTQSGYYYIEAWGGDGGSGETNRTGGVSQKISGVYQLAKGQTINLYVGSAGTSTTSTGTGTQPSGGTNGSAYGNGGAGGQGGSGGTASPGGKGGGGGAGTFIFLNGTSLPSNLLLVSGGGGGGGGSSHSNSPQSGGGGGGGGNANSANKNEANGSSGGNRGGSGGNGNGTGGGGYTTGGSGSNNGYGNGGTGGNGRDGTFITSGGAGGGGGGGGYTTGGGGGGGGDRSSGGYAGGGGGGAGGASYLADTVNNPGYTLPTSSRPSTNGYVVITFFR